MVWGGDALLVYQHLVVREGLLWLIGSFGASGDGK